MLILIGAGVYVGWNIGANDTANCIGTTVGCGLLSYKQAVIMVAVFAILGALLQGGRVMHTIGTGIVAAELDYHAVLVAMLCSGFFVTLATFFRIPVSTSQSIVGGVVGIGLAVGADVNEAKFLTIAESWIVCPTLVMVLAYCLTHVVGFILRRIRYGSILVQNAMGWLAIASACYVAYAMGANNAGNAVGPIANLRVANPFFLLCVGGAAIAFGAMTYGKKVADTVGKGITPLDIPGAFAAQVASAFGMHLFATLGIPVSTSSAVVGAVIGVGLVKGARAISRKTVLTILLGWVLTPCMAGAAAFVMHRFVLSLIM